MKCGIVCCLVSLVTFIFATFSPLPAYATPIDFEGLSDLEIVTTQFSGMGVTFTDATILTSGLSLNQFEFPPHSGTHVVFDDFGPITLTFSVPMQQVSGFFTYFAPLTLTAFNLGGSPVAVSSSIFTSNLALSGDPGSSPNEFLQVAHMGGISTLFISADPSGGSFTLDDLKITPVPEPASLFLLGSVFPGILLQKWRKKRKTVSPVLGTLD